MVRKQIGDGTTGEDQRMSVASNIQMIKQFATNKDVDVDKLERLLVMQEHLIEREAKGIFSEDMTTVQQAAKKVVAKSKSEKGKYAKYDALDAMLRPLYTAHGFSLKFDTGQGSDPNPVPQDNVRVWLYVSHQAGWTDNVHVDMPIPNRGARGNAGVMTDTQATGAAMSYGMRYLLKFFFNVAVGEEDNNGGAGGGRDHQYQTTTAPQSRSERREEKDVTPKGGGKASRPDGYDTIQKATDDKSRITDSSYKTVSSAMKRNKVPEDQFKKTFGFELRELDKRGLSQTVDWIQEQ
jgi:hypothetical protein